MIDLRDILNLYFLNNITAKMFLSIKYCLIWVSKKHLFKRFGFKKTNGSLSAVGENILLYKISPSEENFFIDFNC
jgi:hypothetical protein